MTRRSEHRIAAFIAKYQTNGEQDWRAKWISFAAVAQYCATLRTPRKATAGDEGAKFAYRELTKAVGKGEFSANGRCRVLLFVSHGGKILSITPDELLAAQETFDPETFEAGHLRHCWTYAGLISQWFRSRHVPPPWNAEPSPILHIPRGRHLGAVDHAKDVSVIDLALKIRAQGDVSDRAALKAAIGIAKIADKSGSEAKRLTTKLRKRRSLLLKSKATSSG